MTVVAESTDSAAAAELERLAGKLAALDANQTAARGRLLLRRAQLLLGGASADAWQQAREQLWSSWRANPGDPDTLAVLVRCLKHDDEPVVMARLYAEAAHRSEELALQVHWLLRAVELLHNASSEASGDEQALEHVRRALEQEQLVKTIAQNRPGRARRLVGRLTAMGRADLGVPVLAALVSERHDQQSFADAMRLARTFEQLDQPLQAYEGYRKALSLRPAAPEALRAARAHLLAEEDYEQLAELLAVSAPAARSPAASAELWRELATLAEERLADRRRAAQAWWRAWRLGDSLREAEELKRLYAEEQQWDRYLDVLRHEALRTVDVARKTEILRELAALQREVLGDQPGAAATSETLLQLDPGDAEALTALVEDAGGGSGDRRRLAALERMCERCPAGPARDRAIRSLAEMRWNLGDKRGVLRLLRRLAPAPENRQQIARLWQRAMDEGGGVRRELGRLHFERERAAADDRATRLARGLAIAHQAQDCGELSLAASLYRQLLRENPDDEELQDRVDQLRGSPAAAGERLTVAELTRRAAAAQQRSPRRAARLLVHASALGETPPEQARHLLLSARDICPADADAEQDIIAEAFNSHGMLAEQAELLAARAEAADARRRSQLLRALARLHERRLDQPQRAVEALEQVLELEPDDRAVAVRVCALHRELGNHEALARVLHQALDGASGGERVELLDELGQIHREQLDDHGGALRYFGELLAVQPHHQRALAFCRGHDEQRGDHRSVVVLLSRAAETAEDAIARAELHREIAQISEQHLDDIDFAIVHWRKVVALCPSDAAPRAELKRLLGAAERWTELEAVLLSEVSRTTSPEAKIPLYRELARLAREHIGDRRLAAGHLRTALQLAPADATLSTELARLYEQLGQWRELAALLQHQAGAETDRERQIALYNRAAAVLLTRLDREEEALAVCRRVRELRPGESTASGVMAEVLARRGQWSQLGALLRERINAESDPRELGRLHFELGQLLLERVEDPEAAATHFEMALEFGAESDVLDLLRELYSSLGRFDLLAELVRRRAQSEEIEPPERADAWCEIGRIREEQQDDRDGAREAYERALHLDPRHHQALTALRALLIARAEWRDAVTIGRRELELLEHPPDKARLLVELAELLQEQLQRPSAAAEALAEALQHDPRNLQAAQRLADAHFRDQQWEQAGELLERLVESGLELDDLHVYFYRLAYATERLGDEDKAFSYYVKSFGREPMYLPTLERLVDLCYLRAQWENTQRIAEAIITTYAEQRTPEEVADLYVRLGQCELHQAQAAIAERRLRAMVLGPNTPAHTPEEGWQDVAASWAAIPCDPQLLPEVDLKVITRVIKAMEQALTRVPDHADALQILGALTMSRGDWDRSLRYLERAADSAKTTPPHKARLLLAAGDIAAHRLLSARRAEGYYRRAALLAPDSRRLRQRLADLPDPARPPPAPPLRAAATPPPPPELREGDGGFERAPTSPMPAGPLDDLPRPGGAPSRLRRPAPPPPRGKKPR